MMHLTDNEIQEYVLEPGTCSEQIIAHMRHCDICAAVAEGYTVMFAGMKEQPAEGFDFDLKELVLSRLEEKIALPQLKMKPQSGENNWGSITAGILSACALLYFFRHHIAKLFNGIPVLMLSFIMVTAGTIVCFLLADLYRNHQRKMKSIATFLS